MRLNTTTLSVSASLCFAASAAAAPTVSVAVNPANTVPDVVANSIFADGDGIDWTATALRVDLANGSVYQHPFGNDLAQSQAIIDIVPEVVFDTYVGNTENFSSIAGGAGDIGGNGLSLDGPQISVTWHNTVKNDIDLNQIANISLTDDTQGTWSISVAFAFLPDRVYLNNPVVNGELIWDPMRGDLGYDGFVGIADLNIVLGAWNTNVTPGDSESGDPSGDGFVGIADLNALLGNWNNGFIPLVPGSVHGLNQDNNADGFVGIDDMNIWMSNWNLNVPPGDPRADLSGDGFVGIDDKVNSNWNAGTPPQPAPGVTPPGIDINIPEPASVHVLVITGALLFRRRA